jgi:uncharacterized membrane protein YidH (DUF202 family)
MNSLSHDDLGLQPERTGLAWSRTLVSFAIVLGLLGAHAYHDRRIALVLIATMAVCALLVVFSSPIARWRTRHTSRHLVEGTSPASIPLLLSVSAAAVVASVAGLVMIVWMI